MGRKPKKKTKKQLEEELQKAAEEQKKQEEKERLLKEEEDARNAEAARLAEDQASREKALEAERLEEESVIVTRMKGQRQKDLVYEQSKLQDRINWQKYISCTTRPNVAFENEITTYMTMVREDRARQVEDAMRKCRESEEIVGDLMELWCKAKEEGDFARQDWCMHYVYKIRDMEMELMDDATAHLLQYIEKENQNSQSQVNLDWGSQLDDIKVGFWGNLQSKPFRTKPIEHRQIQISLEFPRSMAVQSSTQNSTGQYIGVRTLFTTYDSVSGKDPSQMPVGGMIRVDLLLIPPFSKKVKGWTIRQVPPPGQELMRLPFPNAEQHTQTNAIAVQPCKIEYKVPAHVLIRKSPTISWWDKDAEKWSTDGIIETYFDPESRKISFSSFRLAAFSITQERHIDLPYQYWSMRPVAPLMCELTIQAARYELHFVISEDGLRLKGPDLQELRGVMYTYAADGGGPEDVRRVVHTVAASPKSVHTNHRATTPRGGAEDTTGERVPRVRSPATLLKELRECGLNLMPEDADTIFLDGFTPKEPQTQARAYSDLSEIAGYYDIASSRHNRKLPKEHTLVRVRENPLFEQFDPLDPDCDTDYQAIMFYPDKSCFVQSLELQPVRTELMPGHTTHASLYLCYDRAPEPSVNHAEQMQRLEVTCMNVRFVESVRQTMQLMRLLSFS